MPKTSHEDSKDRSAEYTQPKISDYGDLVEVTAAAGKGGRVDGTYTYGQVPGYISNTP